MTTVPEITSVPVAAMKPGGTNPRKHFGDQAMAELVESVRTHGVLQPVLLRPWVGMRGRSVEYELVAGERRWRAAKTAGLETIPALVRELTNEQVLEIQVIENLQRVDLHPLEEADGYRALLASTAGYDVAKIAEKVGRSVAYVYDRLKLSSLVDGARELFLKGKIQAGHAIVLARLKPEDQKRAIATLGALFDDEHTLFDFTKKDDADEPVEELPADVLEDRGHADGIDLARVKTRTVRELQAWIDEHVKFDAEGDADPMLFPETAAVVTKALEEAEKVVQITHESFVRPEAKDGSRIYGPRTWKRADPPCERQVTGVIVVGPGRTQAFPVCIDKKRCTVHWGKEIREAKKRAAAVETEAAKTGKTGVDKYELQRQREAEAEKRAEAERVLWRKAAPALRQAISEAVLQADVMATLAPVLIEELGYGPDGRRALSYVPAGPAAADVVRYAAFLILDHELMDWSAPRDFPKRAKALGIDIKAALASAAAKCRGCGCTEEKACKGGCTWTVPPDPKTNLGTCSRCATPVEITKATRKASKRGKGAK